MSHEVALVGASGFVGRSAHRALLRRGHQVRPVVAPRLLAHAEDAASFADGDPEAVRALSEQFRGCDIVVNCAGNPDASSRDVKVLIGANAALPGVVAQAAHDAGATRLVHVSSAAVQGAVPVLDASDTTQAFSTYARSKILGEGAVLRSRSPKSTVIYRPPSVHSPERRVTRGIRRLAKSPLASVVGAGDSPTPQAHIDNVGDAIAELATAALSPPTVVIHPWEGWTTVELMRVFGDGHEPLHIPAVAGPAIRGLLRHVARIARLAPNARRIEMMWFGQGQDLSWLTKIGWEPPANREAWKLLVADIDEGSVTLADPTSKGDDG